MLLTVFSEGIALFWDGSSLKNEPYLGNKKYYHCGKQLYTKPLDQKQDESYLVCIIDNKERIIAKDNGQRYQVFDHDNSGIANKHRCGGQSAARFERQRNELLKHWYKQSASIIHTLLYQQKYQHIYIAGPSRSKNKILPYIGNEFKDKVQVLNIEYCNVAGLFELRKQLPLL